MRGRLAREKCLLRCQVLWCPVSCREKRVCCGTRFCSAWGLSTTVANAACEGALAKSMLQCHFLASNDKSLLRCQDFRCAGFSRGKNVCCGAKFWWRTVSFIEKSICCDAKIRAAGLLHRESVCCGAKIFGVWGVDTTAASIACESVSTTRVVRYQVFRSPGSQETWYRTARVVV